MKKTNFSRAILPTLVSFFAVALLTYGSTTISTDISTGGNLTVTGNSTLTGNVTVSSIGTDMLLSSNGSGLLVSSSTPTATAYRATSTTATSTFMGNVLFGTSTPSVAISPSNHPQPFFDVRGDGVKNVLDFHNASGLTPISINKYGQLVFFNNDQTIDTSIEATRIGTAASTVTISNSGWTNILLYDQATYRAQQDSYIFSSLLLVNSSVETNNANSTVALGYSGAVYDAPTFRTDTSLGGGVSTKAGHVSVYIKPTIDPNVNITDGVYGLYRDAPTFDNTATIANVKGVLLKDVASGIITTNIGVDIETLTNGTNKFAIRTGTNVSEFGGALTVGAQSLPLSMLDVAGNAAFGSYANTVAAPLGGFIVSGNVGIGTSTPTVPLQVTASTTNATTTIEVGKTGQNKGSCLVMYDGAGAVQYVSIQNGAFVISATSCK